MIATAKRLSDNLEPSPEFLVMDAEDLNFPSRRFDCVLSLNAVLHFPNIDRAIEEMMRVLKPGGRLAISFGSGRPLSGTDLAAYALTHGARVASSLWTPELRAPQDLQRHTKTAFPMPIEEIHTEWSRHGPERYLANTLRRAGFRDIRHHWLGNEVAFHSAEEFWAAQAAIVTEVRKRLANEPSETVELFRQKYIARAKQVLDKGGKLSYSFGAVFFSAHRFCA